jgi:HSP20 family protein
MKKKQTGEKQSSDDAPKTLLLGLCRGVIDLVSLIVKIDKTDEGLKEHKGKFRVKGLGDGARGTYGFSMRSGLGSRRPRGRHLENIRSIVEAMQVVDDQPFGNVRTRKLGPVVDVLKKPLTCVLDGGNEIIITAELPGVLEIEIVTILDGNLLIINANGVKKYATKIMLPEAVSAASLTQSYNNGLLEMRVKKAALGIGGKENDG